MVQSFIGRDKVWYDACAADNATSLTARTRANGGDIGSFFHRACPNKAIHPNGVHWNPFRTPNHNCSATSRIQLEIHNDHFWEGWKIQTMDADGAAKTIGGDNFYIVYSEDSEYGPHFPVAVAIPIDHHNGTYGLEFVSIPFIDHNSTKTSFDRGGQRKKGRLTIHALSTCFIGELYPPLKDGWKTGGQSNVIWMIDDITRPYGIQDWYTDRYHDRMYQEEVDPKKKVHNSLSDFDRVVFAGDSILTQMTWDTRKRNYHSIVSEKIQSGKVWLPPIDESGRPLTLHIPLSQTTLRLYLESLDPWLRGGLNDDSIKKKALVLGSAALDIIGPAEWQGPYFENHLSAVEALLKHLRFTYPETTLVWKLPYAHHMHQANHKHCFATPETNPAGNSCINSLRYATKDRFEKLYHAQKTFLEVKFGEDDMVQLLDLYEISYLAGSYFMVPGDSIHYSPKFNAAVLERLLYT